MIGMAAGVEAYFQAGIVTVIALVALRGLSRLDSHFREQARWHLLEIIWTGSPESLDPVVEKALSGAEGAPLAHSVDRVFVREGEVGCQLRIRARKEAVSQVILTLGRASEVKEARTL